ncbi:hypothetical protein [Marinigracilibium pacificum]|uniref:Lipoprotein n=1 Tax=Marinigracilibium pacificum TaxID=2729599 RepID=A0A848J0W1_9BACT|nr:hypothetical protein [Marinigracilibium pacificum]NMM47929.1 hypothetical protein [Marinigracilibium pacificum]
MKHKSILFAVVVLLLVSCKDWSSKEITIKEGLKFEFYNCWTHPFLAEGERKVKIGNDTFHFPMNTGGCREINIFIDKFEGKSILIFQDITTLTVIDLDNKIILYQAEEYDFIKRKEQVKYCGRIHVGDEIEFLDPQESALIELDGRIRIFM